MAKGRWVVTSGTYVVPTGVKGAIELATGAAITNDWIGFDVSFDGITSNAVPATIAIVTLTATGTGTAITYGAAHRMDAGTQAKAIDPVTTAKVNMTVEGAGAVVVASWMCHPQAGYSYQFPLGREYGMTKSAFAGIRITAPAAVNAIVNLWFEE